MCLEADPLLSQLKNTTLNISWPTFAAASTRAAGEGLSAQMDSFLYNKTVVIR